MLSVTKKNKIAKLLKSINLTSSDYTLINIALTHPSYNFERNDHISPDYERLEFLGDSILKFLISEYLFKKYEKHSEGDLTQIRAMIVSDDFLSILAKQIHLGDYINIGEHEAKNGGRNRESILACAFEALLAALYNTSDKDKVKQFLTDLYEKNEELINSHILTYNSKALLQEYTQANNKKLPEYIITNETGLDHEKTYEIVVKYNGDIIGKGIGNSKKNAEKNAAYNALIKLNIIKKEN